MLLRFEHMDLYFLNLDDFVDISIRKVLYFIQGVGVAECLSKGLCKRSEIDEVQGLPHCPT